MKRLTIQPPAGTVDSSCAIDPWHVAEASFAVGANYRNETIFSLANGYLGTRGSFEEAYDWDLGQGLEGTFINGFYESEPISYGELCHGFPKKSQTMLVLPNAKIIKLSVAGEEFSMLTGKLDAYERGLSLRDAELTRSLRWTSPKGRQIALRIKRIVSMTNKHLLAIEYTVEALNFSGTVSLRSAIDADVVNNTRHSNPLIDYGPYGRRIIVDELCAAAGVLTLRAHARNNGFPLVCACRHTTSKAAEAACETGEFTAAVTYSADLARNEAFTLTKYVAYGESKTVDNSLPSRMEGVVNAAAEAGFAALEGSQRAYMASFWTQAEIAIEGNPAMQQGLNFNLYNLLQSAGRDGVTSVGAKGLSGEGYEGHCFWDTEMYVVPVLVYVHPELCRKILEFRYNTLAGARNHARELGHPSGALYPWRTINGDEASAYYPTGSAQYHINGDIAHAFNLYVTVTGDHRFLADMGAEVFCETARVWADVGFFCEEKGGKFCICCVTGPDEYNAIVDNNFYTNLMARENIRYALAALDWLAKNDPDAHARLRKKIGLTEEEPALWRRIVDNMYLPYDARRGIFPADDSFLNKKPWDSGKIPPEKRSLLYVNYHPLFVFRHRMVKQADTMLALYLHENLFTRDEIKRNFDFYETVTLHHSSLSTCIHGIISCQIGYKDSARKYFAESVRMDLDDSHHNVSAGIHIANMAGSWLTVANGFAGMRVFDGRLSFTPRLPADWEGYRFAIRFAGRRLRIVVDSRGATYELCEGESLELAHFGNMISLSGNAPSATVSLP